LSGRPFDQDAPLPVMRGAVAADDQRNLATLHAIGDELAGDGYLYRFERLQQRQLRGNLPQAFVHASMLKCAVRLSSDGADAGASAA
jgi:GH15 family glucan-1,4-alpha-glucosidase